MRLSQTCLVLGILAVPALASAQIKQPGAHPQYSVELEPHLIVEWSNYAPCANDAFGPGFRAAIPFLSNGPIPRINNNMAIGFGLDWAHAGIDNGCFFGRNPYNGNNFSADVISIPVVVQWNFFLLPKISVFGEGGLVIQHRRYDYGYYAGCVNGPNAICSATFTDTGFDATFSAGGRFLITDSVGFLLRLGYPYLSAGVSILL
jgi:hypothetical protein